MDNPTRPLHDVGQTDEDQLPIDALITRIAVKDADALRSDETVRVVRRPGFDPALRSWESHPTGLVNDLQTGDELWTFASPEWTWSDDVLCGRGGYAIVRDGRAIRYWITIVS